MNNAPSGSGYQFAHIESYARRAGKGKAGGHSIASILAEATREPGACPHVSEPQPPILHYGCPVTEVEAQAIAWAEQARDSQGRKLRADGLCLAAGVFSFPASRPSEEWHAFRDDLLEKLKKQYNSRLLSVMEHVDERHPHIHFFAVPLFGERFEVLHPGRQAAADAKAAGKKKGEQNRAYKAAMREWQDNFWERVGIRHGLTRIGPGGRRKTRAEWQAEQNAAKSMSFKLKQIEEENERLEFIRENLDKAAELQAQEQEKIERERQQMHETIEKIKDKSQDIQLSKFADDMVRQGEELVTQERRQEWERQRDEFINPPKSLTFEQAERRKELARRYDYLRHPDLLRQRACRDSRQGSDTLVKIDAERRKIQNKIGGIGSIDMLRERLVECKPWQLLDKREISGKIEEIGKLQKTLIILDQREKNVIASYPVEFIEKYRQKKEKEREKAVQDLLQRELREAEKAAVPPGRPENRPGQGHRP